MNNQENLSHFDDSGQAIMVDISHKNITQRIAIAIGTIQVNERIIELIMNKNNAKGDVFGVARIAGIMAAKKTSELIPLCHSLSLEKVTIDFEIDETKYKILATCTTKTSGRTGVEMEALTGVNIALLTIYDMCKAISKNMIISDIKLKEKYGGKSGTYIR